MQNMKIYSIYDMKAESYGNLFVAVTDGIASRCFAQVVAFSGNEDYARYPEDFTLYCLGEFNNGTGDVCPERPRPVTSALSVLSMIRGAAVGGASPLKQQSAENVDSADAVADKKPACDVESSSSVESIAPEVPNA